MDILAFFTNQGIPATGLSPIIRIRDVSDGSLLVTDAAMTEVGDGHYKYDFTTYNAKREYAIRCDGGVVLPSSERFTFAGNENYFEDVSDAVWSISPSGYDIPESSFGQSFVALLYGDSIYVDALSSWSGTGLGQGIGAQIRPVNNINDAVAIAQYRAVDRLLIQSSITIEATDDVSRFELYTIGVLGTDVTLTAGASAHQAVFRNLNLSGVMTNDDEILVEDCSIGNLENFTGIMNVVAFGTGVELTIGNWAEIIQGTAGGEPGSELEIDIGDSMLNISQWTGNLKLKGKTGNNRTTVNCNSGNIIIDSTCVSGSIQLLGIGVLEADNSGPNCNVEIEAFVTNEFIADQVWDEPLGDHGLVGSTGRKLQDIGSNIILTGNSNGGNTVNTITLDNFSSSDDGAYDPALITIVNGVGVGQSRGIFQYDGSTRTCVVDRNWKTIPTTASQYVITAWPGREHVNEGLAQGGTFNTITLNALASSADGAYNTQVVFIRSGKGEDQVGHVIAYNGATKVAIIETPWNVIPDSTSAYVMLPQHVDPLYNQAKTVWDYSTSNPVSAGSYGELVQDMSDDLKRLLGLTHENIFIDNPNYDSDGNLTSARVRIYSNPASVGTGSNIIGTYQITAPSSAPGQFISWQQVRTG